TSSLPLPENRPDLSHTVPGSNPLGQAAPPRRGTKPSPLPNSASSHPSPPLLSNILSSDTLLPQQTLCTPGWLLRAGRSRKIPSQSSSPAHIPVWSTRSSISRAAPLAPFLQAPCCPRRASGLLSAWDLPAKSRPTPRRAP